MAGGSGNIAVVGSLARFEASSSWWVAGDIWGVVWLAVLTIANRFWR
ncbi:MAG: hypothetical protein H6636_01175 [Anaerolineales bacterium]|nr:hypothetical protein [Anaerolineales bacterium]